MRKRNSLAKPTPKPGRPTVRTAENAERLCRMVEKGIPFSLACSAIGLGVSTGHEWRSSDPALESTLSAAKARGIETRMEVICESAKTDWRCAAWFLEHTSPEHFAKSRIEVAAVGDFAHSFSIPQDVLDSISAARAKRQPERTLAPVVSSPAVEVVNGESKPNDRNGI